MGKKRDKRKRVKARQEKQKAAEERLKGPESIDPNRPTLEQMEEWAQNATSPEEFDRRSQWLRQNLYQNRESVSEQSPMRMG